MNVREVADPAERSQLCADLLRTLSGWFGIDDAVAAYVRDVADLPTLAVGEDGFISLKQHTPGAAEIYVMGVRPDRHRRGIGSALLTAAEAYLSARGVRYLQVKTLGPSHESERYARTRRFYEARGFVPLEELHQIWDESNPCLIMVKQVAGA